MEPRTTPEAVAGSPTNAREKHRTVPKPEAVPEPEAVAHEEPRTVPKPVAKKRPTEAEPGPPSMAGSPTTSRAGPSTWSKSEVSPWRPETASSASLGRPRHHTARRLEATDPRPTVTTEIHRQIENHRRMDTLWARLASARCPPPPRPRGVALAPDRPAGADQRRPGCLSRPASPTGACLASAS